MQLAHTVVLELQRRETCTQPANVNAGAISEPAASQRACAEAGCSAARLGRAPARIFMSVDLPAPFAPRMPILAPRYLGVAPG